MHLLRRLCAFFTALIVAVAGFAVTPSAMADDEITQISKGTVTWGVKDSWRNYMPNVDATDGVTINADGNYEWKILSGTFNKTTNALHLELGGKLHYLAYGDGTGKYALDVTMENLTIDINKDQQVIRGHYAGTSREATDEMSDLGIIDYARLNIKNSEPTTANGVTTWNAIPSVNGDVPLYLSGIEFAPLSISYEGPGGKPELPSYNFVDEGVAAVVLGETIDTDMTTEYTVNGFVPVKDPNTIIETIIPEDDDSAIEVVAYSVDPLEKKTSTRITGLKGEDTFIATSDADSNIYVIAQPAGATALNVYKVQYNEGKFSNPEVLTTLNDAHALPVAFTWDGVNGRLVATFRPPSATFNPEQFYYADLVLIDPNNAGANTHVKLPANIAELPQADTANHANYASRLSSFSSYSYNEPAPVVLADGSYVFAPGDAASYYGENYTKHPYPLYKASISKDGKLTQSGFLFGDYLTSNPTDQSGPGSVIALDGNKIAAGSNLSPTAYKIVNIDGLNTTMLGEAQTPSGEITTGSLIPLRSGERFVALDPQAETISLVNEEGYLSTLNNVLIGYDYYISSFTAAASNNSLVIRSADDDAAKIVRFDFKGPAATITEHPASVSAKLDDNGEAAATFTAAANTSDTAAIQWQKKLASSNDFEDIPGATSDTLSLTLNAGDNGAQVRALFTNAAGTVATHPADITVNDAPKITMNPRSAALKAGEDVVFRSGATGTPTPVLTWQRFNDASQQWEDINEGSDFKIIADDHETSLTVVAPSEALNGTKFRLKAANASATAYSRPAVLGEQESDPATEGETLQVTNATLAWGVGAEIQAKPPVGGSNYLSAGVSDGTQKTYATESGDVEIVHAAASNSEIADNAVQPTYAERNAFADKGLEQQVRLRNGQGVINPDGSGEIAWNGDFSVNFYGGLVPFTMSNLKLVVHSNGTGELKADLSGYGSSIDNPYEKHELDTMYNATIAEFENVALSADGTISFDPEYAGNIAEVPSGDDFNPQDRTAPGWGAWPKDMLDFQFKTGLSSYWYTSSASENPGKKAPLPLLVKIGDVQSATPGTTLPGNTGGDNNAPGDGKQNPPANNGNGDNGNGAGNDTGNDDGKLKPKPPRGGDDSSSSAWPWWPLIAALIGWIGVIINVVQNPDGPLGRLMPPAVRDALRK